MRAATAYLVIVERNQPELYQAIALAFATPAPDREYQPAHARQRQGGGWETRRLPDAVRYGITSLDWEVGVSRLLGYARRHWETANRRHY